MAASGVAVCWVTDHDRPWVGAVPSIRLTAPVDPGETGSAQVVDGLGTFHEHWCTGRRRCREEPPGLCPGHGAWRHPAPLGLDVFVSGVLQGSVRSHQVPRWSPESNADGTGFVWTTRPHVIAERAQLVATTQRRERDELGPASESGTWPRSRPSSPASKH